VEKLVCRLKEAATELLLFFINLSWANKTIPKIATYPALPRKWE